MAKTNPVGPALVAARVIFSGTYGRMDDVVELPQAEIDAGVATGDLDADPAAVAYARGLAQLAAQEQQAAQG